MGRRTNYQDYGDQAFRQQELAEKGTIGLDLTYAGALSCFRRPYTRDLTNVDVAITGIPFDSAVTNRSGTRLGPRAIRAASVGLAELKAFPYGFDPFDRAQENALKVVDYGDCFLNPHHPETVTATIKNHISQIIQGGTKVLSLGGDHYTSYPLLQAHHEKYGKLALVHFDAHCDTWPSFVDPDDENSIDHGTMFLQAKKHGLIDIERSIQIGLRTYNDSDHGFEILTSPWIHRNGVAKTCQIIEERVGDANVYVSFDVDFLDPAYAPGTGTPVSGGVSSHQAMELIQGLKNLNIVGMDVVEVSPAYDHAEITAVAAATVAYQWLCLLALRKGLSEHPVGRL